MRATANHDDHGGAAIIYQLHDNGRIDIGAHIGAPQFVGAARRAALVELVRAIHHLDGSIVFDVVGPVTGTLDDAGQPNPAPVIAALVRHALRSGDVAAGDHAVLCNYLQPACDWPGD